MAVLTQTYGYDNLNRLATATELGAGGAASWNQIYGYDIYGNRSLTANSLGNSPATPAAFDAATNRATGGPWSHDAAGNVLADGAGSTGQYDAENRLTQNVTAGVTSMFAYDPEGRRVAKGSGADQTRFVYDAAGNLAAEYAMSGATSPCVTCYLFADHLGSTRLITDGGTGSVVARTDYAPFGEELLAAGGTARAGVPGYGMDAGIREKFTGKERDSESGLDYFLARYYGPALGRFTSSDPGNAGSDPADPQSWNGYAYVRNGPLTRTDLDGMADSKPE